MDRSVQVRKYFAPFPKWAIWLIVLGIPLTLMMGFGLLLIAGGAWGLWSYSKRPTDKEMDQWTDEYIAKLQGHVLGKIGIEQGDLVGEPVQITGFRISGIPAGTLWAYKKGKDSILRFTPPEVTVMNFTQNQLVVYTCVLDLTTGNPLNETTEEFFYKDVVSISTKTESVNVELPGQTVQAKSAEILQLTTSGGSGPRVYLRDPELIKVLGGGSIPNTKVEKAIQVVRKMLREKKAAVVA